MIRLEQFKAFRQGDQFYTISAGPQPQPLKLTALEDAHRAGSAGIWRLKVSNGERNYDVIEQDCLFLFCTEEEVRQIFSGNR